jgi:ABC-type transport system substrate-binding protein
LQGATLAYDSADQRVAKEYREIRDELLSIGARITLMPLGFHDWLNVYSRSLASTKPAIDLFQFLWIADYPDSQDWCQPILHSAGNFDIGGFSNASYDRLVDAAAIEASSQRRSALYRQAQQIAVQSGAWIAVSSAYGSYVVSARVRGMSATLDGLQPIGGDWSNVSLSR